MNRNIQLYNIIDDNGADTSDEEVRNIISCGADVNKSVDFWYPLQFAIYQECSIKVIKAIVSAGADLNAHANIDPNSDYYQQIEYGELLNFVPLSIASILGRPDIVKFLIEAGADVNRKSSGERTPLDALMELSEDYGVSGETIDEIQAILEAAGGKRGY